MPEQSVPHAVHRLRQSAICLLLVVTAFHQSAGLISQDTKIDLTGDPGRFLGRALDLWNPSSAFGQLQNQAYGYLFPMGPFHLAGHLLGLPDWVTQRAWMSLLLVTAFLGVVRLAARLDLGTPTTRLLGGLAFALSPRVLTEIGGNSSEVLPMALLPWTLIPLVGLAARRHPRRAAMRSGVAVLCMGAVNATAVLSMLPLPALWLVPGLRERSGRRLAGWWVAAVALACTWWFVPLVLQGRYTPSFLGYIETAATTTSTTSLSEVARGTSHWLAYVAVGGQPWWRSGWTLVTNGGVILNTAALAALSVVGLLRRRMPGQGPLVAALAIGLLVMSAGHAGPLSGPFVTPLHHALDGGLAPFRNVHKLDPLVRLPLALGLCHLLALATPGRARQVLAGLVTVALVGTSAPALAGQLVPSGAYERLPSWWQQTGSWLDDHAGRERTLVLPGSGFGEYLWGRPLDNPLQALTTSPWAVRDAVPLGSPGTTRLLDAINARVDTGVGSPALAQVLKRSGVRYLLISNDLDRAATGTPRAALVHQALADSPGLHLAASFGPEVGDAGKRRSVVSDRGLDLTYPALEVYEVDGADAPVVAMPEAGTWVISGGPESLFQLADRGLLGNQATVLAGDGPVGPSPRSAFTDSLRRREVSFGSVRDNASATLTASQAPRREQAVPDVLPVPGVQHLATARLLGADAVSASSSASDAGAVLHHAPAYRPDSAFDGDPATAWVTGSLQGATGQWVQLDLATPTDPQGTTLRLYGDDAVRGKVTSVVVTTDRGSTTTALAGDAVAHPLAVPAGLTRHLRVTLASVRGDGFGTLAGISEISVPGVTVQSTLVLPQDQAAQGAAVVLLDRAVGAAGACVRPEGRPICSPALTRAGEDVVRLDRTFTLGADGSYPVVGSAQPVPGGALDKLLDGGSALTATASSQLVPDPEQRPGAAVDGQTSTGWVAADKDKAPALTVSWAKALPVDHVVLTVAADLAAARPTRVEVTTSSGSTRVDVPASGVIRFPRVVASRLNLRFLADEKRISFQPDGGIVRLPVGVSEVTVPGVTSTAPPTTVRLACGQAPPVVVDGVAHRTAVLAKRTDLLARRPLLLSLCDGPLQLARGSHRVTGGARSGVQVQGLTLGSSLGTSSAPPRATTVRRWDAEHRVVAIADGPASVLVVHENYNAGWTARLHGKALAAQRVDGWQQAFAVPAGESGDVVLTFAPGRTFHLALLLGALLVLLLLALALLPSHAREAQPARAVRLPLALRVISSVLVTVALGGTAGLVAYLALFGVLLVVRREDRSAGEDFPWVVAAPLVLAGLLTAFAPWNGTRSPAAFGTPVQALALVALGAAAAVLSAPQSSSAASGPAPDAPPGEG